MASFWNEFILYVVSYAGIVFVAVGILAWMMSGLLWPYLRVKTSRGKYVLVKVRTITQDYYRKGLIDKGMLIFKDRAKEERRLALPAKPAIYRSMGVNVIDVDDETNNVMAHDFSIVQGFDAVKFNNLYIRAITRPTLADKKEKIIMGLLVLCLLGVALAVFLALDTNGKVAALGQISAPQVVTAGGP